jgi:hypothetical protein
MQTIVAGSMRPVIAHSETEQAAGLEILALNGDVFLVVLSGQGMKGLIQDMQSFLEENPQIAETKSLPRQ